MADAVDCSVEVRESGKVASYFLTVWEPPIDWRTRWPRGTRTCAWRCCTPRRARASGLLVSDEYGTAENTLNVATVGYPTVWYFLTNLGYDFGWESPDHELYDRDSVPVIG
jgi:hypothetical protein